MSTSIRKTESRTYSTVSIAIFASRLPSTGRRFSISRSQTEANLIHLASSPCAYCRAMLPTWADFTGMVVASDKERKCALRPGLPRPASTGRSGIDIVDAVMVTYILCLLELHSSFNSER